MSARFIYVTVENLEEARTIARAVVEERLAACANIIPAVESIYWWQGEVQSSSESVVILKTDSGMVAALTEKIKELHSDEVPCVVALAIEGGNEDFLDWITKETSARP
jgi:periplasmic divalent cation tolerance protein